MEQGILDFNEARYWEAHESWEEAWKKLSEPQWSWMKAMIQVCGVFIHIQKRRPDPALRLAIRANELMTEAQTVRESLKDLTPWPVEIPGASETLSKVVAQFKTSSSDDLDWPRLEAMGRALQARKG